MFITSQEIDFSKRGKQRKSALFAGACATDGKLTRFDGVQSGKLGSVKVIAYRDEEAPVYITVKSFLAEYAPVIAALKKGDRIFCGGMLETREYNGRTLTDLLVDILIIDTRRGSVIPPSKSFSSPAAPAGKPVPVNADDWMEDVNEKGEELPF